MRNQTRYRSLDVLNHDPRVSKAFQDGDGVFIWLVPGFTADVYSAHDIREDTATAALRKYRKIEPCACSRCCPTIG